MLACVHVCVHVSVRACVRVCVRASVPPSVSASRGARASTCAYMRGQARHAVGRAHAGLGMGSWRTFVEQPARYRRRSRRLSMIIVGLPPPLPAHAKHTSCALWALQVLLCAAFLFGRRHQNISCQCKHRGESTMRRITQCGWQGM